MRVERDVLQEFRQMIASIFSKMDDGDGQLTLAEFEKMFEDERMQVGKVSGGDFGMKPLKTLDNSSKFLKNLENSCSFSRNQGESSMKLIEVHALLQGF